MFTLTSRFNNKSKTIFRVAQTARWSTENTAKEASPATGQVSFTLATPQFTFLRDVDVDAVTLPGLEGEFQVNSALVPIITELKPGVVTVSTGQEHKRYFISGGFVFVHENSTCSVNPAECVELENLDAELAKQELQEAKSALGSGQTEEDRAIAQIRVDTAQDIVDALSTRH